jgi:plastocyanin
MAVLAALALAAACARTDDRCGTPRTPTPLDRATAGIVAGTVTFTGAPPPMRTINVSGDAQCAAQHADGVSSGDAIVHDGRVANAFVYLKEGLGDRVFAVPDVPVVVDQKGCLYEPHVAGVQTCQPITFVNSDPVLHNVHGTPVRSSAWNFGMGVQGSKRTIRIGAPEVMVSVRCDVHPWMQAYVGVLDHPYFAVTGADGRFRIAGVPPGEYVVAAWHERFGTREARVTVGPQETREIGLAFGPS